MKEQGLGKMKQMCLRKYVIVCVGVSLKEEREGKCHSFRQVCIFAVRMKELPSDGLLFSPQ